ncbi:MAG: hypothetical protein Q7J78_05515 [Clostridiales bacterium]|nr:hypothetical protein [Clostridiales bacterium]
MQLVNERLCIDIADPGTAYYGARFDWTGFITQVTLDRKHTFCVPESLKCGEGSGGIGLCNEFGMFNPIGYDDAKQGDQFPKLGIGLLTRTDESYIFSHNYLIEPFPFEIIRGADYVKFVVMPIECRGYAAKYEKTITINENCLEMHYSIENVGRRPIITSEYCHNFIGIDNFLFGSDYKLSVPYLIKPDVFPDILKVIDGTVEWLETPKGAYTFRLEGHCRTHLHQWELIHMPGLVGIRNISKFPVSMFAFWGTTHAISPEVFIDVCVEPGKTQEWTRQYEFFYKKQKC